MIIFHGEDYIITIPNNSLYINEYYSGRIYNFGNTDKISYFNFNLPTYWGDVEPPLTFNSNITEIKQIGKCGKSFTAISYKGYYLENLTTISDWSNLTNIKQGNSTFSRATSLSSIPDNFSFSSIKNANALFFECSSLSSIPTLANFYRMENSNLMFAGCKNISAIIGFDDFINNNKNTLTSMQYMFSGCTSITSDIQSVMDLGNTIFNDTEIYKGVFKGCTSVANYNTLTSNTAYQPWFDIT